MKAKVTVKKFPDKAKKILAKMNKMLSGENRVFVGLPKNSNAYPDGTSVIMVAAVHEFGSPARGIPERSFLRSTIIAKKRSYKALFKKLGRKMVQGGTTMAKALRLVGLAVQGDVQEKITALKMPALKSREGNPLVDTGHLRQSITFEVRDK